LPRVENSNMNQIGARKKMPAITKVTTRKARSFDLRDRLTAATARFAAAAPRKAR
jgi:hypothetical protein